MAYATVELGLGGLFRQLVIDEAFIVSAWDLREIGDEVVARDFVWSRNPGTYEGTGWVAGVPIVIPEGALGREFDGTVHVLVPDDGDGYMRPGDEAGRTLSLFGGSIDVFFWILDPVDDATLRAIAQKQETDAAGNGWHVAIQNGAIEFYLKVAGVLIFSFQRGDVADGELHLVHCAYSPALGEARILIDGVQVGATVTGVTTDPAITTADFRIGMFNDDSGGFIGTLSYVVVGRNGNPALSPLLQATRFWTDVTEHVLGEPVEIEDGITGLTWKDRQAGVGTASFVLDNAPVISGSPVPGYYTIGHDDAVAGFDRGIPVRITILPGDDPESGADPEVLFHGRLERADPEPGVDGLKRVMCLAEDWYAATRVTAEDLPLLTTVRSDLAWAALVNRAAYPPPGVSMEAGDEAFEFVFDRSQGVILTEMTAVVVSEGGYGYIRGGIPVFEPRRIRQLDLVVDAAFDDTELHELTMEDAPLINAVRSTITPRKAGATDTEPLYAVLDTPQFIAAGEERIFEGQYQDPDQSRSTIGGTDFQEPLTPDVDYFFTADEGGGINLVASVAVDATIGGSGYRLVVRPSASGWFSYQVRGRVLRTDTPLTEVVEDFDSIRRRGRHEHEATYPYLNEMATARGLADMAIGLFKDPVRRPTSMAFLPKSGTALETKVLGVGISSLVTGSEAVSALSPTARYWVQNRRVALTPPFQLQASFGLFPSFGPLEGLWSVGTVGHAEVGETTYVGI